MRPDKMGNYDAAHGRERQDVGYPFQREYDLHYDRTVELLALGVTPRQLMYFDPDLSRPVEAYRSVAREP